MSWAWILKPVKLKIFKICWKYYYNRIVIRTDIFKYHRGFIKLKGLFTYQVLNCCLKLKVIYVCQVRPYVRLSSKRVKLSLGWKMALKTWYLLMHTYIWNFAISGDFSCLYLFQVSVICLKRCLIMTQLWLGKTKTETIYDSVWFNSAITRI